MSEKNTSELTEILGRTHLSEFDQYCRNNKSSMNADNNNFYVYIKDILQKNGITQQMLFIKADVPERYGYKLLSGEKHTKQRDVILRLCYAAAMTLDETQRALKKYEMPELYPKMARDAFIMIMFNERPGSILDVNEQLKKNGMEPLRTSGTQD